MIIVIARYKENIDWSSSFSNVIIYNKGDPLPDSYRQVCLKNVGREGHSYYQYIVDHYDQLEDYTIFLQGNPFDHSPNVLAKIRQYEEQKELNLDFEFISEWVIPCNLWGCRYHGGLPLKEVYEQLFGQRKESIEFTFGAGAQFIVSKKNILKRPKSFYLKIIDILEKEVDPLEGYVVERFHTLILNDPNP